MSCRLSHLLAVWIWTEDFTVSVLNIYICAMGAMVVSPTDSSVWYLELSFLHLAVTHHLSMPQEVPVLVHSAASSHQCLL